ncbi:hypothetical protein HDU98_006461, partial [Podochytrium sp. JEL0797]
VTTATTDEASMTTDDVSLVSTVSHSAGVETSAAESTSVDVASDTEIATSAAQSTAASPSPVASETDASTAAVAFNVLQGFADVHPTAVTSTTDVAPDRFAPAAVDGGIKSAAADRIGGSFGVLFAVPFLVALML